MTIIQDFIPPGVRNRPGRPNAMTHITIHNTGNSAATAGARNHAAYLKAGAINVPVSWHYTVDDKEVIQHLPDNEFGYHAGSKGNPVSIGIEVCMNAGGDLLKATDLTVTLCAYLCNKYGISPENIKQHNDWDGKNCPQKIRAGQPYNWQEFIMRVREALADLNQPAPDNQPAAPDIPKEDTPSEWAKTACIAAVTSGLIAGDGQGWYGWKEPVTLERLLVILSKPEFDGFVKAARGG
ncbi:MAG: N-acetylmuramoyl-L-alanine amidase [Oscillospiraceae bacterium]|nr:N-acetylmuramoyl-L-alanine amidase [Oscillospiraceae bacterium]